MNKQDIQTVLNALQNSQLFVQASSNINVLEGFGQQLDDADEAIAILTAALAEPSEPVSDLVERLQLGDGSSPDHALLLEAANAIEHLIGELRKGLKQEEILENKLFKEIHKSTPDPVAYLVLFEGAGKLLEFTKGNYLHGAKVEHIPLFTRPASKPSEPVMIYHGGCTIDCGEHGHHNMEMLKLIPAGTKLFTHPASKPEKLTDEEIKRIQMSDPAYMTCSCPAFARQVEAAVWAKFAAVKQDEAIKEKFE